MIGALLALSITLNAPSLDVLGAGPFTNLGSGEQARTNAAAHVWFGSACTLAGHVAGHARWTAVGCSALVLARETFAHGQTPGPEVRTDLLSQLGSIWLTVLVLEALR